MLGEKKLPMYIGGVHIFYERNQQHRKTVFVFAQPTTDRIYSDFQKTNYPI
jgi:hypothetical protein